jgi:hypothetical protein
VVTDELVAERISQAVALAYAHVNLNTDLPVEEFVNALSDGATLERVATSRSAEAEESATAVALGNVRFYEELDALTGRIGQVYRDSVVQRSFRRWNNEFVTVDLREPRAVSAAFALDLRTGWMAVEDVGAELSPDNAVRILDELLNATGPPWLGNATLAERTETLRSFIASVDEVVAAHFTITPTNPGSKKWKKLDDYIRRSKVAKASVVAVNDEGLQVSDPADPDEDNFVDAGLAMAEAGYDGGETYRVLGTVGGVRVAWDSGREASAIRDELPAEAVAGLAVDSVEFVSLLVTRVRELVDRGVLPAWSD